LIQDTTAKGVRRANYTKSLGDGKAWQLKPESEWVLSQVEPIVSEELWNECNALLKRGEGTRPVVRRAVHLFGGRTFCHCGGKMQVRSDSAKYYCLKCKNRIPCDDLEAIFREQLREFFFSPEDIAKALEESDTKVSELKALLATVEGERATVQADMDKIYRAYLADQVSMEGFGRTYKPLEERLGGLEDQIPKLQAELDFLRIQTLSRDELIANAQSLFDRWTDLLPEEKLQIVESVVERITIGKGEVAIDLSYSPSGARNSRNMATRPHGFMAATSTKRAGNTTERRARDTVMRPSSIGCRSASRTRRSNSGISSRNNTP
jgi:site-specific DNA recombinase